MGAWILLVLALSAASVQAQVLPRPQIAASAGKAAPEFTLKDQGGREFRLSAQRGRNVLLVFYRGHW